MDIGQHGHRLDKHAHTTTQPLVHASVVNGRIGDLLLTGEHRHDVAKGCLKEQVGLQAVHAAPVVAHTSADGGLATLHLPYGSRLGVAQRRHLQSGEFPGIVSLGTLIGLCSERCPLVLGSLIHAIGLWLHVPAFEDSCKSCSQDGGERHAIDDGMIAVGKQAEVLLSLNNLHAEERLTAERAERTDKAVADICLQLSLSTLAADDGNGHRRVAPLAHLALLTDDKARAQLGE